MSRKAALMTASQIILKPNSVLGLATGDTPRGMYQELINMYKNNEIDFSDIVTFNLDEYYGLPPDNPRSYHYYMENTFFNKINIKDENSHIPDGNAKEIKKHCREYEFKIKNHGGIDLQILGIVSNGHIGFNEPADRLNVKTDIVELSEETIEANSRFFNSKNNIPKRTISVGMATILKAKRILLLASGSKKAEAIRDTVSGYIDPKVPSSFLQLHNSVILIIDKKAAKLL